MTLTADNGIITIPYNKAVDGIGRRKNPDTVAKNTAYKAAYNQKNYDRITVTIPKGSKKALEDAAKMSGEKSLNAYIINALEWFSNLDLSGTKK